MEEFERVLALPEAEYHQYMERLRAAIDTAMDAHTERRLQSWEIYRAAEAAGIDVADEEVMARWYEEHG